MKKILLTLAAVATVCFTVCAQKKTSMDASHTLVAYFSATGTTAKVARDIAAVTSGTLFEIAPQTPYTAADLDWHNKQSRSSVEMGDDASRPALKNKKADIADYDTAAQPEQQSNYPLCHLRRQQYQQQCFHVEEIVSLFELARRKTAEQGKPEDSTAVDRPAVPLTEYARCFQEITK